MSAEDDEERELEEERYGAVKAARRQALAALPPRRAPKIQFFLNKFNGLIRDYGYRVLWQQSMRCGCRLIEGSEQPNPNCPLCAGNGREYFDAREIDALVENVTVEVDPDHETGVWYSGVARVTVRAEHPIGFRDRIVMLDAVTEFEEVITRGGPKNPGPVFRLRYRIVPRIVELEDLATHEMVRVVERVIRLRAWYEDGSSRILREFQDFDVLPNGLLDLTKADLSGRAPIAGERFGIKYTFNPTWTVTALEPQYFRHSRDWDQPTAEDLLPFPRSVLVGVDYMVSADEESEGEE